MKIFERYIFKNLAIATVFIGATLTIVIFLTQSLRFLELVIDSGASSTSFWMLTFLALPRFFEIVLPLALMSATIFLYNRMTMDSELVVIRAAGYSPYALARPALMLAVLCTFFLFSMTMWFAPRALANMEHMRQVIKAQLSNVFFREGVFNQVGKGLTVYIRKREGDGELAGLMIHDTRTPGAPATILARRGVIVVSEKGHQALVYEGSRQDIDARTGTLRRLNFERYAIDLPDSDPVRQRWAEPDERTIFELLRPDPNVQRDMESLRDFHIEIHRRIVSPLLALTFTVMSCAFLLVGPVERRGQGRRILMAIAAAVTIQGLFLASANLSRQTDWGLVAMYALALLPMGASYFMISGLSEKFRRRVLYKTDYAA